MRTSAVFAAVAVGLMGVAGSASAAEPAVIQNVSYSPKPLYNDKAAVTISFEATRNAKPGYEWGVRVSIHSSPPMLGCTHALVSYELRFGGNPQRHYQRRGKHIVTLREHAWLGNPDNIYLCRGKARVRIVEHKIGSNAIGHILHSTEFRIAEAP